MSTLVLVRHAQASFFAKDYDQLSELGEQQARNLGAYFVKRGVTFDEVYTGPAKRHQRTAELVGEQLRKAGLPWPDPSVLPDLHEHSGDKILTHPSISESDQYPELRELFKAYKSATDRIEIQRGFQRLFEQVVARWSQGEFPVPGIETWEEFQTRVRRGLRQIMTHNENRSRRVVSFSSVGPITISLQMALSTPMAETLTLGWRLRNCSVSSFLFDADRFTLDAFNSVAHLENDEITYR
ncbi:MAG: histidine phosphatase family protein [Planctomycetaceae bacterium]